MKVWLRLCSTFLNPFVMAAAALLLGSWALAAGYPAPPTLSAQSQFPSIPLNGPHYRVQSHIQTDGFLTRTAIESDFGPMEAVGPGMLAVRLNEVQALAKLQELENSEQFKQGVKESAGEKWNGIKSLVEKPKETVQGITEGVGRFFQRTARSTVIGVQTMGDILHERSPGATEEQGTGSVLPGGRPPGSQEDISRESKYLQALKVSGDVAVAIAGFEDSRRGLAKRLGVDPYTTNPILDEKLDDMTWAIFAGDLGVDIATSLIPGGAVVSTSTIVTEWVWDTQPGDLRVRIERSLQSMGISKEEIDRLLRHRYYPLSMKAELTAYLEKLDGVAGRAGIMPLALSVASFDQARFVVGTLAMTVEFHQRFKPVKALETIGTIVARTGDGMAVVTAPVDYVSWNQGIDTFSKRPEFSKAPRQLHIAGQFTEQARSLLKQRGWQAFEHSPLFKAVAFAGR